MGTVTSLESFRRFKNKLDELAQERKQILENIDQELFGDGEIAPILARLLPRELEECLKDY